MKHFEIISEKLFDKIETPNKSICLLSYVGNLYFDTQLVTIFNYLNVRLNQLSLDTPIS